jgi:hypothetical protein
LITFPLTRTRPADMNSSQPRRDPYPKPANIFCTLSKVIFNP